MATPSPTPSGPMPTSTGALQPSWLRALEIVSGVLAIVLAALALADLGIALTLLVFLLAFALLVIGFQRLGRAFAGSAPANAHRAWDMTVGVIGIFASIFVLVVPGVAILTLVVLLFVALFFLGLGWLWFAFSGRGAESWYRWVAGALGFLSLIAAAVAFADVRAAVLTLVLLLAFGLLVIGIGDLISGWTGHPYPSMFPLPLNPFTPGSGPFAPPPPGNPPAKP